MFIGSNLPNRCFPQIKTLRINGTGPGANQRSGGTEELSFSPGPVPLRVGQGGLRCQPVGPAAAAVHGDGHRAGERWGSRSDGDRFRRSDFGAMKEGFWICDFSVCELLQI